jgi:NAD(P)-dependent dehydrogenase (short-subunit alcohol dehydrogenase family)
MKCETSPYRGSARDSAHPVFLMNHAIFHSHARTRMRITQASLSLLCRWLGRGLLPEVTSNLRLPVRGELFDHRVCQSPALGTLAVVTGATGGIGEATCRGLAQVGFEVIVAARNETRGEEVAASIRSSGGAARFVRFDASVLGALRLAESILRDKAPLGLLVNNAGLMGGTEAEVMTVNLVAPAVLCAALLDKLRSCPYDLFTPRVVNVASSAHLRAHRVDVTRAGSARVDRTLVAYGESKLGLLQVSTLLRAHCVVHDVHPGLVWTPMLQRAYRPIAGALDWAGVRLPPWTRTPAQGAATVLAACLGPPQVEPHLTYYADARPKPGSYASEAHDAAAAAGLWKSLIEPQLLEHAGVAVADDGFAAAATCARRWAGQLVAGSTVHSPERERS